MASSERNSGSHQEEPASGIHEGQDNFKGPEKIWQDLVGKQGWSLQPDYIPNYQVVKFAGRPRIYSRIHVGRIQVTFYNNLSCSMFVIYLSSRLCSNETRKLLRQATMSVDNKHSQDIEKGLFFLKVLY